MIIKFSQITIAKLKSVLCDIVKKTRNLGVTSSGVLLASNRLTLLQAGVMPQSLQSLDGIPNAFRYGLTALALERIPNRMSTSRCVMTTLHLGRDDRGKENAVSPPFRTVSRFELEIGTSLLVWSA